MLRINDEVLLTNSEIRANMRDKYPDAIGGLRIFDTSDPFNPKFVRYVKVDGRGVALRGGHHCAQPLMDRFGLAGTTRASLALYNDDADVDALLSGLDEAARRLK